MKEKLNKIDIIFGITFLFCMFYMGIFLFTYPFVQDEPFYLTIPFRLVNGDSLVQHEWHLTQFSSLFSYLPMLIWTKLTGSFDGILVFMRCIYLFIQALLTVTLYIFFRKYKLWAVAAAALFFTQPANVLRQINYHTMLMSFVLLLTLCLISIHKKPAKYLYIISGFIYGLCCVCDPGFCLIYILYLVICLIWKQRNKISKILQKLKLNAVGEETSYNRKKQKRQKKVQTEVISYSESYSCFFSKTAVVYITTGILIAAFIAVMFFFATGGTIESIFSNVDNMLASSEYNTQEGVFIKTISKIKTAVYQFNLLTPDKSFSLILLMIVLYFDKKRTANTHRYVYLVWALILAVIYTVKSFQTINYLMDFSFFLFSTVCYVLTKNKRKKLFYCMWLPGVIALIFHFFSSNLWDTAFAIILPINNTAGVFFVADLLKEFCCKDCLKSYKKPWRISTGIICIVFCLHFVNHIYFHPYASLELQLNNKATVGPYSGIYMTDEKFKNYSNAINDLEFIKKRSDGWYPIYIASYLSSCMYMYLEQPIAAYTAFYFGYLNEEALISYYKENPKYIPKYIYIDYYIEFDYNHHKYNYEHTRENVDILSEMFYFTEEPLSNGILLTVTGCKFSVNDTVLT